MNREEAKAYLESRKEDLLEDLRGLIRIPSVSCDREQVEKALDYILSLGRSMGFQAESLLDGQVGVIEAGEGPETLGILAHVDVVDPGDRSVWNTQPFEAVIKEGRIYGRGTLDDKGPVIAALYGMKAAREIGGPFRKRVRLILGTREEVEWTDMQEYVKRYELPDYGFTPDGEFPLCNIEKGGLDLDLVFPFADEPALGERIVSLAAGTAQNIVPGCCTAVLEKGDGTRETVEVRGKAVHSCQPEKGDNAILRMAAELGSRNLAENGLSRLLAFVEERFADLYGRNLGLYSSDEYYNGEFVHRNVFSPTMLAVEGGQARLHINVRFPYGEDPRRIAAILERVAGEQGGRVEALSVQPAVYVDRDRPFVRAFARAYEEASGRQNEYTLAYGGSYAKAMKNVVSWGPIFPGEEDTCHEENEFISIESLMTNALIFSLAIGEIAFSEESFR